MPLLITHPHVQLKQLLYKKMEKFINILRDIHEYIYWCFQKTHSQEIEIIEKE